MFGILCPKLSGDDGVGAERHGKPLQYSFAPFHAASFSRLTSNLFSRHGTMAGREKRERSLRRHTFWRAATTTRHTMSFCPHDFNPELSQPST